MGERGFQGEETSVSEVLVVPIISKGDGAGAGPLSRISSLPAGLRSHGMRGSCIAVINRLMMLPHSLQTKPKTFRLLIRSEKWDEWFRDLAYKIVDVKVSSVSTSSLDTLRAH